MIRFAVLLLAVGGLGVASCSLTTAPVERRIILENTSDYGLTEKPVIVKRKDLPDAPAGYYPLLISHRGDTIPSQLDDTDGDTNWDELFFVTDISPKSKDSLQLSWVSSEVTFEKRTSIRFGVRQTQNSIVEPAVSDTFYADQLPGVIGYQHYQTDGPTWENDKVGFRLYLDGRNSIDVFGKKVSYMTPENVGIGANGVTENNYSVMKDWGTDILAVGNSVGIGGISLLVKDSLVRLGVTEQDSLNNVDTTIFKILAEGPSRSVMQFNFKNWKPANRNYNVESRVSVWPGTYAFNNTVRLQNLRGDETLVIGLVNSKTNEKLKEVLLDDWVLLFTHDRQSLNKEWWLGMALILPREHYLGFMEAPETGSLSNTYLGKLKVQNDKPISYFAVAAWEASDERFRDAAYFNKYLNDLVKQISSEVKVQVQ